MLQQQASGATGYRDELQPITRCGDGAALGTAVHITAVLSAEAVVLAVAITFSTPPGGSPRLGAWAQPVVGLLAAAVGALIAAKQPRNLVAWLLIASGASSAAYSLTTAATALGLLANPQAP
ncbi:hypothetical protein [Specibacter sp. NPDC078692]|uniref:hypothetical protein n=1 Tax=Specibacter sp. NPDC078692 TaxID=3155818 RepID=UPI003418767A